MLNASDAILGYLSIALGICEGLNSVFGVLVYVVRHREIGLYARTLLAGRDVSPKFTPVIDRKPSLRLRFYPFHRAQTCGDLLCKKSSLVRSTEHPLRQQNEGNSL